MGSTTNLNWFSCRTSEPTVALVHLPQLTQHTSRARRSMKSTLLRQDSSKSSKTWGFCTSDTPVSMRSGGLGENTHNFSGGLGGGHTGAKKKLFFLYTQSDSSIKMMSDIFAAKMPCMLVSKYGHKKVFPREMKSTNNVLKWCYYI